MSLPVRGLFRLLMGIALVVIGAVLVGQGVAYRHRQNACVAECQRATGANAEPCRYLCQEHAR